MRLMADSFSVYLIVEVTITQTITASDGNAYLVTATYTNDSAVPLEAELRVREITEEDEAYAGYVEKSVKALGDDEAEGEQHARAFDIALVDPETDEEYEPVSGVKVSIRLLDDDLANYEDVKVVHIHGEEEQQASVMDSSVDEGALAFTTDGFSVYVIIAHEGDTEVQKARVEFHFIDRYTNAQYQDSMNIPASSTPYNFVNEDGKYQTTQILTEGETLELITDPANLVLEMDDGTGNTIQTEKFFYGWYVVDLTEGEGKGDQSSLKTSGKYEGDIFFTWPENPQQIHFEQTLSITGADNAQVGDNLTWKLGDVSGSAKIDEQGTAHVYLAPLYEDFYFINFHKGAHDAEESLRNSLVERKLVVFGSSSSVSVRIGDVTCESTDFEHMIFAGWEEAIKDNSGSITGYKAAYRTVEHSIDEYGDLVNTEVNNPSGKTGYYISVTKSSNRDVKSMDLYPVFDEARWMNFHRGAPGNGATYVGAAFRLSNDYRGSADGEIYYFNKEFFTGTDTKKSHLSRRLGYTFDGWYLFANMNEATGEITNLNTPENVSLNYIDGSGAKQPTTITTKAIQLVDGSGNIIQAVGKWYVSDTGVISQTEGGKLLFEVVGTGGSAVIRFYKALDQMDLYAKWTEITSTTYQVLVWKQKVTDDVYAADADKTYDYSANDSNLNVTGVTGRTLAQLRSAGAMNPFEGKDITGFHCNTAKTTMSTDALAGDGTTVINVYYDRNLYTLTFQDDTSAYDYTATTSDSGTQYAFIGGQWVELTRGNAIGTATEYFLTQTNGGTTEYTGTVYDSDYNEISNPLYNTQYYYYYSNRRLNPLYWNSREVTAYEWLIPEYGEVYTASTAFEEEMYGDVGGEKVLLTPTTELSTKYVYTSTLTSDNDYLIVSRNTAGSGYVLGRNGTTVQAKPVTVNSGSPVFINVEDVDSSSVWTVNVDRYGDWTFTNGGYYLRYAAGSNWGLNIGTGNDYRGWDWNSDNNRLRDAYNNSRYLRFNNGAFSVDTTASSIYMFGKNTTATITGYTYNGAEYTGTRYTKSYEQTGNTVAYTGTRFTRSANETNGMHTIYVIEALYQQDISFHFPIHGSNGVYYAGGLWQSQGSSIFSDSAYVGYIDRMQAESTRFNYYSMSGRENHVIYYVESLPGGNYDATFDGKQFIERQDVTVNGDLMSTESEEFTEIEGFTKYKSDPAYDSSGHAEFPSNANYTIKLYYTRNSYKLTFNVHYPTVADLSFNTAGGPSQNKAPEIKYQASLADYASYFTPNIPDHYSFGGWYADEACTKRFDFNTTMPAGDIMIYARWSPVRYYIKIDPNGGEIDHVNHNGYLDYGSGDVIFDGQPYHYDFTTINSSYKHYPSGYNANFQTYIRSSHGTVLSLYEPARGFVPMTEKAAAEYANSGNDVYYYVNYQMHPTDGASGINNDSRSALYLTQQDLDDFYALYRETVIYSVGKFASANAGMVLLDKATWMQTYVDHTMENGMPVYTKYRPINQSEHWTFLGWYKTPDGGVEESTPYNAQTPVDSAFTLTAHWRLDGGYVIRYIPEYTMGDGAVINGTMPAWSDPADGNMTYADGANTKIYKEPTNLTKTTTSGGTVNVTDDSVIFRGWALASATYKRDPVTGSVLIDATGEPVIDRLTLLETDEHGNVTTYYYPSDPYVVNAVNATSSDSGNRLYFQAIYQYKGQSDREPEITNLRLDANSGYVKAGYTGKTPDSLPFWDAYPGTSAVNLSTDTTTVAGETVPTQILFGDIQSSAALHLYKYATDPGIIAADGYNYFTHEEGHFLLGFDDEPNENDYIATYSADGVIAVTRDPDEIIYAVWEPMVYMTFKNETDKPVTFSLAPENASDNEALEIINVREGMYRRRKLDDYSAITLQPKGDANHDDILTFAFPQGAEKTIRIYGTNDLGPGRVLMWDSSLLLDDGTENGTQYDTKKEIGSENVTYTHSTKTLSEHGHMLVYGEANNSLPFSFTEDLIVNKDPLVVTFHDRTNDYALILNDNFPAASGMVSGTQEKDFAKKDVLYNESPVGTKSFSPIPDPNSCPGYRFLGWASSPDATLPEFVGTISDMEAFFEVGLDPRVHTTVINTGNTVQRILYAVWEEYLDENTVYIFKDVPAPGNRTKDFTFNVTLDAGYTPQGAYQQQVSLSDSGSFTLRHGQYAKLYSTQNADNNSATAKTEIRLYNTADNKRVNTTLGDAPDCTLTETKSVNNTSGSWTKFDVTVSEDPVAYYTTSMKRQTQSCPGNTSVITLQGTQTSTDPEPLTVTGNKIKWTSVTQMGTVIYTNQRETYDVKVEKKLVSKNETAHIFSYTASYVDEGVTTTLYDSADPFKVESGKSNTDALQDVPAGVRLTVTEITDAEDNYAIETVGKYSSGANSGADVPDGDSIGTNAAYIVTELSGDATLTYTNTLKFYDVTFKLVDQDDSPLQARFSLAAGTSSLGTELISDKDGVFYKDSKFWADTTYTLKQETAPVDENDIPYINLIGQNITLRVTGKGITSDNSWVTVSGDAENGYVVTVKNWKPATITVKKVMNDVLLTGQRTFNFNYSYTSAVDNSVVSDTLALTPTANDPVGVTRDLRIPIYSTDFVIEEVSDFNEAYDTDVTYAGSSTGNDSAETVSVSYTNNSNTNVNPSCTIASTANNSAERIEHNGSVTFVNTLRQINLTVKKTVTADDLSGNFAFEATLFNGNNGIANHLIGVAIPSGSNADVTSAPNTANAATTDANGQTIFTATTDANGQITFTMESNNSIVLTIPVGAKLTIRETDVTGNSSGYDLTAYETSYTLVKTGTTEAYNTGVTWSQDNRLFTLAIPSTDLTLTYSNNIISGSRKVILRKVSDPGSAANPPYTSLANCEFTIHKKGGTVKDAKGNTLSSFTSSASGVLWIGELNYGTYDLHETKNSAGNNVSIWFSLEVGDDTVEGSRDGVSITEITDPAEIAQLNAAYATTP